MSSPVRPRGSGGTGTTDGGVHALKALGVIAVVVLLGVLILDHAPRTVSAARRPTTPRTTVPVTRSIPPTTTTTLVPAASVKLQVLNGYSSTQPLAGEWSRKLRTDFGYNTLAPDNATSHVSSSIIYLVTPGYAPEAYLLATRVGLKPSSVDATTPAPPSAPIPSSERTTANLVLVVGPDLASSA